MSNDELTRAVAEAKAKEKAELEALHGTLDAIDAMTERYQMGTRKNNVIRTRLTKARSAIVEALDLIEAEGR